MNYEYIEKLVIEVKNGDKAAKENLVIEFTPYINSIARKTFIHGYEKSDIKHECFKTLFLCIPKYKINSNSFISYAINSMKNNISDLIRKIVTRNELDGFYSLSLDDNLENSLSSETVQPDDKLCNECDRNTLLFAINNKLNDVEKDLIDFIFFKGNTLTNYAYYNNISRVTASKRKKKALSKLQEVINYGN